MKDAQKPDHVSLNTLINYLREGRFVIPDFQREFEWKPWDIRDLVRSIFLDYYIGSLLLWKGKKENFEALDCEPIYGFEDTGKSEYIVLDGQQRLTALYYVFMAPDIRLPSRANRAVYFVHVKKFMDEEYDDAFHYDWLSRRFQRVLDDRERQYQDHIFPLSIIGQGGWELPNWVQGYEKYWIEKADELKSQGDEKAFKEASSYAKNARDFGEHLRGITEQYQISYIELDRDIAIDKVCDIFTQINSKGVRLDVFDLLNALLKPKGLQLKNMWREASTRLEFVDSEKMNVYILQVMSILKQAYCSPKYLYYLMPGQEKQVRYPDGTRATEILVQSAEEFTKCWNHAVDLLETAIKMLHHPHEFGVITSNYLPYVSILPAFSAMQSEISTLPTNKGLNAQRKVRHWYWASVFLNRYSGSVESTSARDYLDVKAWLNDDEAEPALINEFKSRFRNIELRKEVKRGSSLYNGIFNLLVIQGARDWITGNIPQHDDLDDHHIVPASWGAKNLSGNQVHTILNRTPLTPDSNRKVIRDRLPNEYLPELIENNGESVVKEIMESHFISPDALGVLLRDPFTPDDFDEFILIRQKTIQDAIENLLVKERLDLPPQLRELDSEIEKVELNLRKLVDKTLDGDIAHLPGHVNQKVAERIKGAVKRDPTLDSEFLDSLAGKLEFCDLRELQDTLQSKELWGQFESTFASKGTLAPKFDQLANLRNGIRHSRSVDEVTRMEGEAAILWFKKVLNL